MKTEVYSWRVSTELKTGLEREARRRKISLAKALDLAADEWLKNGGTDKDDDLEQKRIHEAAQVFWRHHEWRPKPVWRTCASRCESACGGVMAADALIADALIDTGAIVAMLNARDPWSRICRATFQSLRVPLHRRCWRNCSIWLATIAGKWKGLGDSSARAL